MAGKIGELYIEISAKLTDIQSELNKLNKQLQGTQGDIDKVGQKAKQTTEKLRGFQKFIADLQHPLKALSGACQNVWAQFAIGSLAADAIQNAISFVGNELKSVITAAMEAEQVITQLDATLVSMGGAAVMTRDELVKMSKAIQDTTIYSDASALAAETMMLRFQEIGRETFPQAMEAATNVAAALGVDLVQAAESVGRALEDPTTAARNLRAMNILLNDEQKKTIESLVKTGQVAQAQKLILDELNVAYGNAAKAAGETFAGKLAMLKNQYAELKEQIGAALLPVLKTLVEQLLPIVKGIAEWTNKNQGLITASIQLMVNIEGLKMVFIGLKTVLEASLTVYEKTVGLLDKLGTIGEGVKNGLALLPAILDKLAEKTREAGDTLGDFWDKVSKGVAVARDAQGGFLNLNEAAEKFNFTLKSELIKEIEATQKALKALKNSTEATPGAIKALNDKLKKLNEYLTGTRTKLVEVAIAARDLGPFIFNSGVQFKELALDLNARLLPALDKTKTALIDLAMGFDLTPFVEKQEAALTASEQAWLDFKNNVAQDIGEVVGEALKLPKVIDDWVETWPPILKGLFKTIYDSFLQFVKNLIAVWVTKFLTDTLIKKTADAAPSVIDGLKKITEGAAGAISGVASSTINTIANVVSAAANVLNLFKKTDYSSITYWLKPMSERLQEIRDYLFIVLEGQHLGYMHDLMVDDNKCLWDLVYKGQDIKDILSSGFASVVEAIKGIGSFQSGGYVPQTQLALVHKGEYVMPPEMVAGGGGPATGGGPVSVKANIPAIDLKSGIKQIILEIVPKLSEQGILQFHVRGLKYV